MNDGAMVSCARYVWGQNAKGLDSLAKIKSMLICIRSSSIVGGEQSVEEEGSIGVRFSAMTKILAISS
jgi:hypothetical protein